MKQGLIEENGSLFYYKDDKPYHAGAIQIDGAIYYIKRDGRAAKGVHIVHKSMSNGILEHGTYTFGDDHKLIPDSFIPAKRIKSSNTKRRKSKKNRSGKISRLFKQNAPKTKKLIATTLVASLFFLVLCVLSICFEQNNHVVYVKEEKENTEKTSGVFLPVFDEEVLLCSQAAKDLYDKKISIENAVTTGNPYRSFVFEYQLVDDTNGVLLISEEKDFSKSQCYEMRNDQTKIVIDNLKTGTNYYYRVITGDKEYDGSFKTAESTRFVYMEGVLNTRDIGGYSTMDGKRVKQGLLIRGREIDGLVESSAGFLLPNGAAEVVQEDFHFVYDFDLRYSGIYASDYHSYLGDRVKHQFYNSPQYGQIFQPAFHDALRLIFSDLADPNKYPMYLHCTYGADRTGTIVFLLQGILNMSEEDMLREYQMTGFASKGVIESNSMDAVIIGMRPYEGDTLAEKIVTWLTTVVGVTNEQIESIRHIFLED